MDEIEQRLRILWPERQWSKLTPREMEVLHYHLSGDIARHMANRLRISTKTVDAHLRSCAAKLDVMGSIRAELLADIYLGELD